MNRKELHIILTKYIKGTATPEQIRFLESYYQHFDQRSRLLNALAAASLQEYKEEVLQRLHQQFEQKHIHRLPNQFRWWAAAAVFILFASGVYWFAHKPGKELAAVTGTKQLNNDLLPGGNKAILTLADGTKIVLDSAANGNLAQQGNTQIEKLNAGMLLYHQPLPNADLSSQADPTRHADEGSTLWSPNKSISPTYNTLTTPRGGQYQVVLPDGTKVWLNAASSIKFPTVFAKERVVEITGELYLEVATDKTKPFILKTNGTEVQVLGTSFNINAYLDEDAIKTTLIEGSIRVSKGAENMLLKPGEQAQTTTINEIKKISLINGSDILAWKNGLFYFNGADLKTIMRQLMRWYNIEVQYKGPIPSRNFSGEIQRNLNLSDVLEVLKQNNVHFSLEGKKLTVMP